MNEVGNSIGFYITIVATIFGAGFPLIIGCIERIDAKYNSSLLSARFKRERNFINYKWLLITDIILAVVMPFVYAISENIWCVTIHAILTLLLIIEAVKLFLRITIYYDAYELEAAIMNDYNNSDNSDNNDNNDKNRLFSELIDVIISLPFNDKKDIEIINEVLSESETQYNEALTRLNKSLCKKETNDTVELVQTKILLNWARCYKDNDNALWDNLQYLIVKNRDNVITQYWEAVISIYLERFDNDHQFEEFHIMLCAMLLFYKKYGTLEKILFYKNCNPAQYYILPSRNKDILRWFHDIDSQDSIYYETLFPILNQSDSSNRKLIGSVYLLLGLLMYRSCKILPCKGTGLEDVNEIDTDNIPCVRRLEFFKSILENIKRDEELMNVIKIKDIDSHIEYCKQNYNQDILSPIEYINELINR